MKLIANILIAGALTLTALPTAAQKTERFTANKANEYGLTYSLPQTVLDIVVETETTTETPGEFYNYANRYLSITDAVHKPKQTVKVRSVTVIPRGIPDPENRWLIQFKNNATTSMLLTDGGVPLTINTDKVATANQPTLPKAKPAPQSPLETEAARQAVTLEMSRSGSLFKKAELASQRIFELREQRNELISGNSENMPADGSALKVALAALDDQEAALTAMFAGTRLTGTTVSTFTFTPGKQDVKDQLVCRVSPLDGVTEIDDLRGIPLTVSMKVLQRGQIPVNDKGEEKRFPKGGVAYVIPGTAQISVQFLGETMATATVDLAQLGAVFGIDPDLFSNRKAPMAAQFSPVTGAIVSLEPAPAVE